MSNPRWLIGLAFIAVIVTAYSATVAAAEPISGAANSQIAEPAQPVEAASNPVQASLRDQHECEDPFNGEQPKFGLGYWEKTNFCIHSIDYDDIFSGGPPPDGIPPIDDPTFVDISSADAWLQGVEPVISLVIGNDARAYPLQIMTWHEIVNDEVNAIPVAVTFCPLCNTALVFERPTIDGETLTFGTSGNLRYSDLVMYDRQTESWWQQFSGEGIVGELTGEVLAPVPAAILAWDDFKAKYPQGQVLSKDTGFSRSYGQNPYVGYDNVNSSPFLYRGEVGDQLRAMDRVVGIFLEDQSVAYSYIRLAEEGVINDELADRPISVFWKAGTASALDTASISQGNDVGSTGVFETTIFGEVFTFTANPDGTFTDEQTQSTWDIFGTAISGTMEGTSLAPVPHHDTFWFAWGAFVPGDTLSQ